MKKCALLMMMLAVVAVAHADVIMDVMIDSNAVSRGFIVNGTAQEVTWSGIYEGVTTDFNDLDDLTGTANFSMNIEGFGALSGTVASGGGSFNVGARGGGIDDDTINEGQSWTFTFDVASILTDVNYYGKDAGQQSIVVNGTPVSGSPFDGNVEGASIAINANETLQFGCVENTGNGYTLVGYTMTLVAVPEPTSLAFLGLGLGVLLTARRRLRKSENGCPRQKLK